LDEKRELFLLQEVVVVGLCSLVVVIVVVVARASKSSNQTAARGNVPSHSPAVATLQTKPRTTNRTAVNFMVVVVVVTR